MQSPGGFSSFIYHAYSNMSTFLSVSISFSTICQDNSDISVLQCEPSFLCAFRNHPSHQFTHFLGLFPGYFNLVYLREVLQFKLFSIQSYSLLSLTKNSQILVLSNTSWLLLTAPLGNYPFLSLPDSLDHSWIMQWLNPSCKAISQEAVEGQILRLVLSSSKEESARSCSGPKRTPLPKENSLAQRNALLLHLMAG